ncbi:SDR family NAD(P)-dependent oxidoreductase [Bradyrhizobium sp. WSM2254]|uniref:SDR family NAD(P)-dependent oxidoreductase n=1 Tax=Bradyrhizobium sp. WSM2254 TaxID=1188263 RepID=UPI00047F3FBE|nr:SDR family oxidoreductase [Bradyrhizobium sp. WSM2254]
MGRLEGKAVLVTGAGSGIGAACVRRLIGEGALIAAVDLRQDAVDDVLAEFNIGDRAFSATLDVADREQVGAFFAAAQQRFGRLHGLINCAGIRGVGSVLDVETEGWQQVMAVNVDGTVNMCQAFARLAIEDVYEGEKASRSIVNISSGAGLMGVPNRLSYVASKFAVSGITRTMCAELGKYKIRVNAVAPGMTRTPFTDYMFQDPENVRRIRAAHPIGREADPDEIAAAIVFLLCDDASFITGAVIPVDGGSTACIPSH